MMTVISEVVRCLVVVKPLEIILDMEHVIGKQAPVLVVAWVVVQALDQVEVQVMVQVVVQVLAWVMAPVWLLGRGMGLAVVA